MLSVFWKSLTIGTVCGTLLFLSFAFLSWGNATRENTAVVNRLIQRLDTDALITERALAHLEGRIPSLKAQQYQLRTEESAPRLLPATP